MDTKASIKKTENDDGKQKGGIALASLILGIISIVLSLLSFFSIIAAISGVVAVVLGIVALVKKIDKTKAVIGLILGAVGTVISIIVIVIAAAAFNAAVNIISDLGSDLSTTSVSDTDSTLGTKVDVTISDFEINEDGYFTDTKLPVTVKNLTNEAMSFSIHIEAVDKNGNRIDDGYVYASDLSAGQSQSFETFTYVSDEDLDAMKNATFNIVDISAY